MKLLVRQLALELARSFLIVAASLLVLFDLIAFLNEAEDIGNGNYGVANALTFVLLSSPARLIDLTPFVCLLGALLALSQFNRTSELTAVRTAGVSPTQIARITVLLTLGYVAPMAALDWTARPLLQDAILDRMHATTAAGNALRGGGFWTVNRETYVHVAEFDLAQRPKGIRVFEFDDAGRLTHYLAAAAADVLFSDRWKLRDVVEKTLTPDRIETRVLAERDWIPVWGASRDMYALPNDSLSIEQLRERISYQQRAEQSVETFEVELWTRMTLPLTGLVFALFAAPFALRPKPRGGMAGQLALGSVLALVIYLAQQLFVNASVLTGVPAALAVSLPIAAVLGAAWLLLRRTA